MVDKLSTNIYRFKNQKSFGEEVNIYLIETKDKLILIDIPNYSEGLRDYLKSFDKEIIGILTHGPSGSKDGAKWQKEFGVKFYMHIADKNNSWLDMTPDILFENIPQLSEEIEIFHTPGHTKGCLCIYHKESKSLFTGDSILYNNAKFEIEADTKVMQKVLEYDFKNLLPLHYEMILKNGKDLLKKNI
jgi:glyoxylase-like metal-dependent hydrolase (beta-lactamase superfamily II)